MVSVGPDRTIVPSGFFVLRTPRLPFDHLTSRLPEDAEDARTRLGSGRPSQDGAHAGGELVGVERLGDVVVGAEVEALRLVGGRALGGQQDDRDGTPFTELAHDLDTVEVGHHDVEQDDVRADLFGLGQGLFTAAGGDYAEALLAEGDRYEFRDPRFIVCDEYERLGAHGRLRYEMTW